MDKNFKDESQHLESCLRMVALTNIDNAARQRLIEHFGDCRAIFETPISKLGESIAIPASKLRRAFNNIDDQLIAQQLALVLHHNISAIAYSDATYPQQLKHIAQAPPVLFVRGDIRLLSGPQLAMVGSRKASPSGIKTAQAFASEFAGAGLTITSGLASGIDTAAHQGAIDQIGSSVAVVATGLDEVYPRNNLRLARSIVKKGCMISEFPPLTPARRAHFPQRNRLISGLSLGVLVVEADTRSGSLITARLAGEQGREIFAIPGSIHSPTSRGCHQLIRQGAKLVETTADVMVELQTSLKLALETATSAPKSQNSGSNNIDKDAANVLNHVEYAPTGLDDIATHSNLPIELVLSKLLQLELVDKVSPLPGNKYQRLPEE